jgi:hypothetical protein
MRVVTVNDVLDGYVALDIMPEPCPPQRLNPHATDQLAGGGVPVRLSGLSVRASGLSVRRSPACHSRASPVSEEERERAERAWPRAT